MKGKTAIENKKKGRTGKKGSLCAIKSLFYISAAVFTLTTAVTIAASFPLAAHAAESREMPDISELSQIMTAERDVDMKAAPEESAETIKSYEKGASVFVTGETGDGWYRVIYQDKEGYVPKDALQLQEIDVEGLDAEMAQMEEEAAFVVESVEKYRVEARRSRIWGGIIILLVAGIFAVGIVSGIRGAKDDSREKTP